MNKPIHIYCMWILVTVIFVCCSPVIVHASIYTPKTVSKLVANFDPSNPHSTGRIPLILIHGVHGTDFATFNSIDGSTSGEKAYFENFLTYFYSNSSNLKDYYKLYRFHYLSDELSVYEIAQGLQEWLDEFIQTGKMKDVPVVILAHSMGGLVARSYMQEHVHAAGVYAGDYGGERVLKLITLATPHHGSPGANGASRDALMINSLLWEGVIELASFYYNSQYSFATAISDSTVNRSDLRTDDFAFDNGTIVMDDNAWLTSLNRNTTYDNKVIAYYSSIDLTDPERVAVYDEVMISGPIYLLGYASGGDNHQKLLVANIIMNEGLSNHFMYNDGMVPDESAKFSGHSIYKTVGLADYDHLEMIDGKLTTPELFDYVSSDLIGIYSTSNISYIIGAEYFIDTDPGEGNGLQLNAVDGAFDSPMEEVYLLDGLDTINLTIGIHYLYIRMQNDAGVWGTPRKIMFAITGQKNISEAEYFVDADPGAGNGISIPAVDGSFDQAIESISIAMDTSGLALGMHTFYIRVRNSEDKWGTPREHKFEVREPLYMTSAEFFVDNDPGVGNGTPLVPLDGSFDSVYETVMGYVNTSGLCMGSHNLYVRAYDSYSRWGGAGTTGFKIYSSSPTPIAIYVDDDNDSGIECGTPEQPFNTIPEAIDIARSGDAVQVLEGTYWGPITITQDNISLYGEGEVLTVSDASNLGAGIQIDGRAGIHVEGFTLQNGQSNYGGGININDSSNVTIMRNALIGNMADFFGGGIAITGDSSSIRIVNNLIANNASQNGGSGIFVNTTGAGIEIINDTIVNNSSATGGIHVVQGTPIIRNCILWDNSPIDLFGVSDTMISYSLIGDGTFSGTGNNITADPLFVLGDSYYHLVSCSPGVDAGDPADDYSLEPAPNGSWINIGAYGNTSEAALTPQNIDTDLDGFIDACDNCINVENIDQRDTNGDRYGNICDPDLDNNGAVGISDFGIFKTAFGTAGADADFDGNGAVGISDFGIFKNYFGNPPGPSGLLP